MANVENRPYAGNWRLNQTQVVKVTPDALVYINGDLTILGCPSCNGRINVQDFITAITVDAGTEPTSHSASLTLSLPKVQGQQLFVDGQNTLRPGLEVHIFMRGYFAVSGQFQHLAYPDNPNDEDRFDLTNYASFPYYPVFHGIVTQTSYEYSDGFYTGSVSCASMLHFWQYQNITSNQAFLGARPNNTPGKSSLFGHNFNNMHPYGIIYTLYRDTAGAAGAIEFALDEESNLAAVEGGTQLFDQVAMYWEQRFKTRVFSLRMYGVNGQLFNSVQQAYLTSASNRDVQGLLSNNLYSDPETSRSESDPFSSRYSVAKALGLANGGLDLTYAPFVNSEGDAVNVSILDMYAFNQQLPEIGTLPLFETTYQTKMEVAQQVQAVTGYELYQDVDGDLVFKPPFYNLDTSTNRFYRLEDIDIISISFAEKEPEATYITVRGSWFKGLQGVVPNTGVTGKRAVYIDYKLVAQFGWRPASEEVAFTTDPRILFYFGIARMDRLNVDVNSASVTIPWRPELRPGYPVYIPFVDSYYYLTAFSLSFAFGGQCTMSLTLTCRRSKFNPPALQGVVPDNKSAVDLVRLDRPDLPRRRLEVYDRSGSPKNVGFPNVVLALDPSKANPQFFPVGAGLDYLNTEEDVRALYQFIREDIAAQTPQIFEVAQQDTDVEGRVRSSVPTVEGTYILRLDSGEKLTFNLNTLIEGFNSLQSIRDQIRVTEEKIRSQQNIVAALVQSENVFASGSKQANLGGPGGTGSRPQAEQQLVTLNRQLQEERQRLQQAVGDEGSSNQNALVAVVTALQKFRGSPARRKIDGLPGSDVKATYFDTLLNLKSQYVVNDLPGRYRYYSSAHPEPQYQGQPIILFDDGEVQRASRPITGRTRISADNAPEITIPTDGIPGNTPAQRLQAKLDLLGIQWIGVNSLSADTLIARGQIPADSTKGSKPLLTNRGRQFLTEEVSNNIANVAEAANRIRQRLLNNSEFVALGFSLGGGLALRVPGESNESEAMHATGKAFDFGLRPSFPDVVKEGASRVADYNRAFDIMAGECLRAFGAGEVNFVQTYRFNDKSFVHIDQRTQADVEAGTVSANQGFAVRGFTDPTLQNGQIVGNEFIGENTPLNEKIALGRQERLKYAQAAGVDLNEFFENDNGSIGRKRNFRNKITGRSFPLQENPSSNTPPTAAPDPSPQVLPQPQGLRPSSSIRFREVNIDPPRRVVQFKKTPATPVGRRAATAELDLGPCTRGFNIAQGPGNPPQILTSDQIQTLSFVQFNSAKFTNIVGTSNTTGDTVLNNQSLFTQIAETFATAAQDVEDPEQTPEQAFGELYNTIKRDIEAVEVPNFQNGIRVDPPNKITVPSFAEAVDSVPIPENSPLQRQFSGTSIPVATTSFRLLSIVPRFSSNSPKNVDSQEIGGTVERVSNAYSQALTAVINQAFQAARNSALEPKEGKSNRLSEVELAFRQITNAATGSEQSALTLAVNTVQEKVGLSSKASKNKFVPIFPVSDEKGYEHYGVYRYGRGLTVDPGGTFEFLHSDGDPFQNIDAQSAEEFLRSLTLVKSQSRMGDSAETLRTAVREADVSAASTALRGISQEVGSAVLGALAETNPASTAPLPPDQRARQAAQSAATGDLDRIAAQLRSTSQGQEALRQLLETNGDDPNLITLDNFDITQTQFARNFSNFAANYATSPVFKTTVANAAYRLADITSHILDRTGSICSCRGAQADVQLAAYGQAEFLTVEGIDSHRDPATALLSETILLRENDYFTYMAQVRGSFQSASPSATDFTAIFGANFTKAFQTANPDLAGGFAPGILTTGSFTGASVSSPPVPRLDPEDTNG